MKASSSMAALAVSLFLQQGMAQAVSPETTAGSPEIAAARATIETENSLVGKAIATRNFDVLRKYWSPDLVVNSPANQIVGREQVIESMNQGGLNYSSLKGIPEFFTVTNGTAILMSHEEVVMAAGPMAGKHLVRRSTDIYQPSGDNWLLVARQATYIGFDGAILAGPVTTGFTAPASTAESDAALAQIKANGAAVGHAIRTRDFAGLEKVWSPALLVNSPGNKVLTRDQVFTAMREDKLNYTSYKTFYDAFYVHNDLAIQMGHEEIVMGNGPMAGQPLKRRFTDVWQKTGETWMMIARQATYVGIDGGAAYGHPDPALNR